MRINQTFKYNLFTLLVACAGILGILLILSTQLGSNQAKQEGFFHVTLPAFYDGLALDHYVVESRTVKNNDILGSLLSELGVPNQLQHKLITSCSEAFNLKALRQGHRFYVFKDPKTCDVSWLIYEPGPYRSYKIKIDNQPIVEKIERPVNVVIQRRSGEIRSSLWNAMIEGEMPIPLIIGLEAALECAVDFHHLQKGDHFKVIYEEDQLGGERIGLGKIQAISFHQGDSTYHAIYYEKDTIKGYYDLAGRPMKSMFLKAPVRFSRISSYFSSSRLHPILKIRRPHLGTDFAAPYGTEILAVADGTVTEAARRGGNGNFVRIRHTGTYETQYLHMQRFAKGIKAGTRVRQGQVIGYVGATGLATGPHVCFRFWKNGKQVNPIREKLPESKPLPKEMLAEYFEHRDRFVSSLSTIPTFRESIRQSKEIARRDVVTP
jgi:murein DD-endopeptidase MepM/ murein hydrolase activator NlpD